VESSRFALIIISTYAKVLAKDIRQKKIMMQALKKPGVFKRQNIFSNTIGKK
jgi:hypothetical protein